MSTIQSLRARQILDSRGTPTVEVDCILSDGSFGRAAVPSGASTGSHEALELRDGDKKKYGGKGVEKAVSNVLGPLQDAVKGMDVADQRALDAKLIATDGTPNKTALGANAILGVSMAVCRARAVAEKKPLWQSLADQFGVTLGTKVLLPVPMMNILNGGAHTGWQSTNFQEFMVVPTGAASFSDAVRYGAEIFSALKSVLKKKGYNTNVGDEGGFAPAVKDDEEAIASVVEAISAAGYAPGKDVAIALDAAASELWEKGTYQLRIQKKTLSQKDMVHLWSDWTAKYPIVSLEDGLGEDDWDSWAALTAAIGATVQIVGDDLLVTNTQRIEQAIEKKAANAVLIKLNQIGSVSETVDAIQMAQKQGWNAVVSHRSGETEDTFIAHLSVGLQAGQIKTGSLSRTDRVCKYNELLRIEEELGSRAAFESPFGKVGS